MTATNTGGGSVTLRADNTGIGGVSGLGLNAGFGQVTFAGGKQIKLSGGGATPGNINILDDGFSAGAFTTPINSAGNVTLAAGGNPIGRLIGFNSTFIETCRARASLCR